MTGDGEERNRVLGFPLDHHPNTRPARKPRQPREPREAAEPLPQPQGTEPQRLLGFPVDWLDGIVDDVLRPLLRRIRGDRRT